MPALHPQDGAQGWLCPITYSCSPGAAAPVPVLGTGRVGRDPPGPPTGTPYPSSRLCLWVLCGHGGMGAVPGLVPLWGAAPGPLCPPLPACLLTIYSQCPHPTARTSNPGARQPGQAGTAARAQLCSPPDPWLRFCVPVTCVPIVCVPTCVFRTGDSGSVGAGGWGRRWHCWGKGGVKAPVSCAPQPHFPGHCQGRGNLEESSES